MLSLLGFVTVGAILALLLTHRVTAVVALAGIPVVVALVAGFTPADIGEFAGRGIADVAGTTAMFVFAITFFGVLRDAGMFEPVISRIVAFAGNSPATVCVSTTVLAMAAHLDGAGATTFLITIPAMLPIFDRTGMRRLLLATCAGLGAGIMNVLPWGGPTARASSVTGVSANDLWVPLIPTQVAGIAAVLVIAWLLGRSENKRMAAGAGHPVAVPAGVTSTEATSERVTSATSPATGSAGDDNGSVEDLRRPKLFWFNVALAVAVIGCLIAGVAEPEVVFLAGLVVALVVNYPGLKRQTNRIEAHAKGAMLMATTLLAAGVFLGILQSSGMIEAMATTAAEAIPGAVAPALPLVIAILGVPLSFLFGPDAFYFGVLPVLTGVGARFGIDGGELARAALLGQETLGFPISPLTGAFYLLVGLSGVEIGKHIRTLLGWAWLTSGVMVLAAVATGALPVWAT